MKVYSLVPVVLAACVVFTYAAPPPELGSNAPAVAKTLGVSSSNITYLGNCAFGPAPPSGLHVTFRVGIAVLTRDSLVLMEGKLPNAVPVQRIKFREMRGVDLRHFGRGRQLQILTSNGITVVERNPAAEELDSALRQSGVSSWKSDKYYLMKIKAPMFVPIPM